MNGSLTLSPTLARRLAIIRQHLAGPRPQADSHGIMDVMRDLRYLQIDPMRVVEQSHLLVLWSRLGKYDQTHLDRLLWEEKQLFEDWAQATSIVLTEDYPIFSALKSRFASGNQPWAQRIRSWMKKNEPFRRYILEQLRLKGPLPSNDLEDRAIESWQSTGWTKSRNVDMMLLFLRARGEIMVAGHKGRRKLWNPTARHLPEWAPREHLSDHEVYLSIAQKSLRALGVARAVHVKQHFTRGCCKNVEHVMAQLEEENRVVRVEVRERKQVWRGPWYVHADDLSLIDRLEAGEWDPRTTLLSPFDNLICDRKRTEQLFNFHFRFEVYAPKDKRKYGCYVMPILRGDRLIGRVDPVIDRGRRCLTISAVYVEPDIEVTDKTVEAVADSVRELAGFLGAEKIAYGQQVPKRWKAMGVGW